MFENIVKLFREPALFFAALTFFGQLLFKKSFPLALHSAFKTLMGGIILFRGVDIIVSAISPMAEHFTLLFSNSSSLPLAHFSEFITKYSSEIGGVMLAAFLINIIVAKFTKWKSVFLTVNLIFWFSMLFTALGIEHSLPFLPRILLSSLSTALYLIIPANLIRPLVKKVSKDQSFTIGHTASLFCFFGAGVGKLINKNHHSAEDMNIPESLSFLKDPTILAGLTVFLIYSIFAIINPQHNKAIFPDSLMNGALFAAGVFILLTGVRLIFSELIPAFYALSQKWVPDAVPALDIPMIFPYGQNSLVLGFVISLFSSIGTLFLFGFSGLFPYALFPLTVACYFDVAPGAIFANKWGGTPAVILSSFLSGILLMTLCAFSLPLIAQTAGNFLQLYGGNDFSLWIILFAPLYKFVALFL